MADLARLETALQAADQAGDTAGAQQLAQALRQARMAAPAPTPPPKTNSATATPKLGPVASQVVRPLAEGLSGIVTAIPDFATSVANLLPQKIGPFDIGPPIESPGALVQRTLIDPYTTAPTDGLGRLAETFNSALVGGAAGPKLPGMPSAGPITQRLATEGVVTTPGQRAAEKPGQLSKIGAWLEEKLSNIHPSVRTARATAQEQWRTARLNEALRTAGGQPVPASTTGRDALRHTYEQLQERYEQVLSQMRGDLNNGPPGVTLPVPRGQAWQPGSLREALERIRTIGQNLDPSQRNTLSDILDNQVIGKFTAQGRASGERIKEMEETLRTEAEAHESGSYQDRKLAAALRQAQAELDTMLRRVNPRTFAQKEAVDKGYAQYKLSEKAATIAPTKEGAYTPGQRLSATKARDTSKDKGRFARGQVGGQAEAEEAQRVLGNIEPNSGTPAGMALLSLLGGTGGALVGTGHPVASVPELLSLLGPMGVYNPKMLRWLQQRAVGSDPERFSKLGAVGGAQQAAAFPGTDQTGALQ